MAAAKDAGRATAKAARGLESDYGRGDHALRGYAPLLAGFGGTTSAVIVAARLSGRRPEPATAWDLLTVALATHKIGRLVAKDAVTSPLRAPFTRFHGPAGDAEVEEEVTGSGPWKAIGELLTCPFCIGPWAALAFMTGRTFAPALTQAVTGGLSAVAAADFLHLAYAAAQQRIEPAEQRKQEAAG
jgi:hypothetical protein